MQFLALCYLVVLGAGVWRVRHHLDHLLWDDAHVLVGELKITGQREEREERAWPAVRLALILCILALGLCHAYDDNHMTLVSKVEAARAQEPPFGCLAPADRSTMSYRDSLRALVNPTGLERECAEYLERIHASVWPNPLDCIVDCFVRVPVRLLMRGVEAAGDALGLFLEHFSYLLQTYIMLLLPLLALALLWSWPVLRLLYWPLTPASAPALASSSKAASFSGKGRYID